jgi:uncharacterized RmlC-like cupin family protein
MANEPLTCRLIRPDHGFHGKQGLDYFAGISAESTGATGICMHMVTFPPGAKAKAHLHDSHETAIYVLKGTTAMWYGENLTEHMVIKAGEFLYIPAGMPHLPYNPGDEESVAVLARTDPNEQESVRLLPELER